MNKKRRFRTASQLLLVSLLVTSIPLPSFTSTISVSAESIDKIDQESKTEVPTKTENDIALADDLQRNIQEIDGDIVSGTQGTSDWRIDSEGILHISEGTFTDNSSASPWEAEANQIVKIVFEGPVVAGKNCSYLFSRLTNVQIIEGIELFDTSNVTSMASMFYGMSSLTSLDVSHFDTSKVTYMANMFNGLENVTNLDVSGFDTSNVTHTWGMFQGMTNLTSLDVSGFDTSKVTYMDSMFSGLSSLTSLDVSSFDTSSVTDMSYLFCGLSSLTSLDLRSFNTANVTTMFLIFKGMSSLSELSLGTDFTLRSTVWNGSDTGLPDPTPIPGQYTGKWINIGNGTIEEPKGLNVWDSTEFMNNYDGVRDTDTYVWQPDLTMLNVYDSTLNVGDEWKAEDNFDSALDKEGNPVAFKDVKVTGEVDTSKTGIYEVIYSYEGVNSKASITVKEKQSVPGIRTIKYLDTEGIPLRKDIIITPDPVHLGAPYKSFPLEFPGYTLKESQNAEGIITEEDTTTIFIYSKNEDHSHIVVHDSTLKVGEEWSPEDNFDEATDFEGNIEDFSDIVIEGSVDTTKAGIYEVTYSIPEEHRGKSSTIEGHYSATAKIVVSDEDSETDGSDNNAGSGSEEVQDKDKDGNSNTDTSGSNNIETTSNNKTDSNIMVSDKEEEAETETKTLPQTGETFSSLTLMAGIVLLVLASLFAMMRKKQENI